jgi:hypothetical protein
MGVAAREEGQAAVELVAGVPALLLAGLIALQLLAAGQAASLADGAAEAGALALAAGRPAAPAARAALPAWARERARVEVSGGRVEVELRPPASVAGLGAALAGRGEAWARPGMGAR